MFYYTKNELHCSLRLSSTKSHTGLEVYANVEFFHKLDVLIIYMRVKIGTIFVPLMLKCLFSCITQKNLSV